MRKTLKKLAVGASVLIAVVLFALPAHAHAFFLISAPVVILVVNVILFLLNMILGLVVGLSASLAELMMRINDLILDSSNSVVGIGWGIARDVANLGFVIVIIVIAFATMFRVERYGATKALTRLIAAAILINFSLTIAGVFITFAGSLTHFFLDKIGGAGTGLSATLMGAFGIQRFFLTDPNPLPPDPSAQGGLLTTLSTATIVITAGQFFGAIFLLITILVFLALALMLLVRYVTLSILLVLAPIAWLFWVVPPLEGLFSKWWSKFLEWVFFAPAVSFFIYLALIVAEQLGKRPLEVQSDFALLPLKNIVIQGAQMVVLAGIMIGGLIAAQKMGITGAAGALGLASKAGKGVRAWAGKKSLQTGSAFLRRVRETPEGEKITQAEAIQRWSAGRKSAVGRYATGWLARGATRLATAGGEDVVKYYESRTSKMNVADAKAALLTATGPYRIALVKMLTQAKELGKVDMKRLSTKDNKELFARYNQGKFFDDAEKGGLMNVEAAKALETGKGVQEAADKLIRAFTKKDVEIAAFKDLFSGKARLGFDTKEATENYSKAVARAIATENHNLVANILPKLDGVSRKNFVDVYGEAVSGLGDAEDAFKKTLAYYSTGFSPAEGGGAPPAEKK